MNQGSQMGGETKKQKKASISEDDVSTILQRYSPKRVLGLLQEVAQIDDAIIDWNALVKRTKTGITNRREYQMLWRHLAYRDSLLTNLEDDTKPLDDDSDLECELDAFPSISNEASMEAAACVKVLIASGSASESSLEKGLTVEAPLTINIPKGKPTGHVSQNPQPSSSTRGTNIIVPVSVQKQLPTVNAEGTDTNGPASGNLPPRRKRKPWSEAEDFELFTAVQKCGEGNWANILKGDFKGDRTASQLSHRWNIIKKRHCNLNIRTGLQLSEVQLAARRALNMALDQPVVDKLKAASSFGRTKLGITANTSMHPIVADTPAASKLLQDQSRKDDAVKAAAVFAGARITTQPAASAMLKQWLKTSAHVTASVASDTKTAATRAHLGSGGNNANVGPLAQLNQNGTNSPKKLQEDHQDNGNLEKVEALGLNENVCKASEAESKQDAAVPLTGRTIGDDSEPVMLEICENGSTQSNQ